LVTSKLSFLVTANIIMVLSLLFGNVLKKLFFGSLRDTEMEILIEKCKYSIIETCFALTIFRNELSLFVIILFGFLLFIKVFHWLIRSRIDYLEQIIPVPMSTHIRIQILLLLLITIDVFVSYRCIQSTLQLGKSVLILFGFEFVVLSISSINYSIRYLMLVIDSYYENGLHYKGLYTMILDIICDGLRFVMYVAFFSLLFIHYGLPIHIMRLDLFVIVYLIINKCLQRGLDVICCFFRKIVFFASLLASNPPARRTIAKCKS
jgi:E3 ubiquitin-protein ligase synoviolin